MKWNTNYIGEAFLGLVIHEIDDFPFHRGTFQPSEDFRSVALLFEREIHCFLNLEKWLNGGRFAMRLLNPVSI